MNYYRRKKKRKPSQNQNSNSDQRKILQALRNADFPSRQEAAQYVIRHYQHWLENNPVYFYDPKTRNKKTALTPAFARPFEEHVKQNGERSAFAFFAFPKGPRSARVLKTLFINHNLKLAGIHTVTDEQGQTVDPETFYMPRLTAMWLEILEREVPRYFTKAVILDCLEKNPRYPYAGFFRKAQEEILREIPDEMPKLFPEARQIKRHFILHIGPTNSGKTYEALQACMKAERGIYLAPLRLLAMEVADRINAAGIPCSMRTGEEEQIIPGAQHVAATMEMIDFSWFDVAVLDECQMIADADRGWAWTQAVLGIVSPRIHACMAKEAEALMIELIESCGDTWEIHRHERETPLIPESRDFIFPDDVQNGDALVVFSRRSVLQAASLLEDNGLSVSVIYGALPYHARRAETEKFASGESKLVVCTDAIGMGMNLPVKRIVFLESKKFDGYEKRALTPPEIKQIAGRAGRRGLAEVGRLNALYDKAELLDGLYTENTPLTYAKTNMPERLITIDRPLSMIMHDWESLEDQPPYRKTSMTRSIMLCEWLEKNCPEMEKEEMYRAVTIPFDERDTDLLNLWKTALNSRYAGQPIFEKINTPTAMPGNSLEGLEKKYKILDLLYAMLRAFPGESEAELQKAYIMECKGEVTEAIIQKLRENKQEYKRCKRCGTRLPWNFPYRICDHCKEATRAQKRYRNRNMKRYH